MTQADRLRRCLRVINRQLEADGFFIHNVHFTRNDDGQVTDITMNYTEAITGSDTDNRQTDIQLPKIDDRKKRIMIYQFKNKEYGNKRKGTLLF